MFRKSLLVAALVAGFAAPAAAQMVTKSAPAVGYPSTNGFYYGVGASSAAGSASVANSGILAVGAGLDLIVGYQWKGGLDFIAAEFDATYTNFGSSATCNPTAPAPCSTNSAWELEPLVKFGFPVSYLTAVLPNLSQVFPALPQLPANFTPQTVHPYIYAGTPIRDLSANYGLATGSVWNVQAEVGLGALNQMQQGVVVDARAGVSFGGGGVNLTGPSGIMGRATQNTVYQTRISVLY